MSGASAYASSVAQEENYRNQAQAYQYQARMQEREARYIDEQNNAQDEMMRKELDLVRGTQTVSAANSGVLSTSGSPLFLVGENAARAELGVIEQRRSNRLQSNQMRANAIIGRYNADVANANADMVVRTRGLQVAAALFQDIASGFSFANNVTGTALNVMKIMGKS